MECVEYTRINRLENYIALSYRHKLEIIFLCMRPSASLVII